MCSSLCCVEKTTEPVSIGAGPASCLALPRAHIADSPRHCLSSAMAEGCGYPRMWGVFGCHKMVSKGAPPVAIKGEDSPYHSIASGWILSLLTHRIDICS